jgi:molecular chaperone GrpE
MDSAPEASQETPEIREWRDRALRLQAEMDNYRKRQQRIAQEQSRSEQERLLHDVLGVADDLDRTLAAATQDTPIRRGVALTRDGLMRLLRQHGVERVEARDQPFDPTCHEAVDVVSAAALGVEPGVVVRVTQAGYRRGERLLRPARVVVAQ